MERARMTAGADDGFGDLLRRARRAAGHSQEELAERAGISARAISDLERGVNRVPRRDTLELIADALDLPKDERRRWERARRTMATQGGQADVRQPDDASTSGVPVPLTALVGREREIAEIRGLLFEGGVRLLTLTGPGGVGKTRLAVEVAQHAQAEDPKGVSFVSLGAVRNSDRVLAEIGRALRVREQAGTPIIDRLISHLASMRLLLVLDNVEQVIEAAGSFAVLLERCPALKLLVTSRTPLRIRGEQQYAVAPLAVPDGRRPPNVSTLADYPAVDLFVLRATQANSSFALTDENAATVAEICMRLDGLPLAIELAAARITALSPRMLLERLERPLALLAGGPRDLPDRQRTMRAAIQWSYDLLEPEEQRLFRRLSVFVGGWTLEAAEAVCETGVDTLDALVSLVEHGLVQHVEQLDGTTRYRMLEPIREFGLEQSRAAGEIGEAQQQLARFIARLIESGEPPRYWSPISDAWLQRCAIEHANIRTALDWRLEHEPVGALRLASSLYWFWRMHGYLIEGTRWLEEALHLNDGAPAPDRAKAIASLADLACWQSQFDRADRFYQESLSLYLEQDDPDGIGRTRYGLARSVQFRGDLSLARERYEDCMEFYDAVGDMDGFSSSRFNLAAVLTFTGELDRAQQLYEESQAWRLRGGDHATLVIGLANLSGLAVLRQDWPRVLVHAHEALRLHGVSSDLLHIIECLEHVAVVLAAVGQAERAARLWGAADAERQRVGYTAIAPQIVEKAQQLAAIQRQLDTAAFETRLAEGRSVSLDDAIADALAVNLQAVSTASPEPAGILSKRELEVLRLIVDGKTNQEIAAELFISPNTVANHVTNLLNKLGLDSRTAAATYAVRKGLV